METHNHGRLGGKKTTRKMCIKWNSIEKNREKKKYRNEYLMKMCLNAINYVFHHFRFSFSFADNSDHWILVLAECERDQLLETVNIMTERFDRHEVTTKMPWKWTPVFRKFVPSSLTRSYSLVHAFFSSFFVASSSFSVDSISAPAFTWISDPRRYVRYVWPNIR